MSHLEEEPLDWFVEATNWYVEKHQGCPWCGGANCVYRSQRGSVIEYHCGDCDFLTCQDQESGRCYMRPGRSPAPHTMHAAHKFLS
jgi:hypothetical protein